MHRIGRTGRANETGDAITFVSPQEHKDLGEIERGLGKNIPRTEWEGTVPLLSLFRAKGTDKRNGGDNRNGTNKPKRRGGKNFRPRRRLAQAR